MSQPMSPRRPLPRSVYIRRRIVVVLIALAIVAIVVAILWPRGAASDPTGLETPGDGVTNGESNAPLDGDACDLEKIQITADTDATEYQAGQPVLMSLTLQNNSANDCIIQVGSDVQVFTITSPSSTGDEVYWTSTDCQTDATPQAQVLKAGIPISTPQITWDRHRSVKGECDPAAIAARPVVGSGGASFDLTVKVGDLESEKKRIYLH